MNVSNLRISMEQAVMDFQFFMEYKNSLTAEEMEVSNIDFNELGIY